MYNPKFNYQPIPRVTIEGKLNLPSVTTILDKTKSEASKAALHNCSPCCGGGESFRV